MRSRAIRRWTCSVISSIWLRDWVWRDSVAVRCFIGRPVSPGLRLAPAHILQKPAQGGAQMSGKVDVCGDDQFEAVAELSAVDGAVVDEKAVEGEPELGES